MIQAVLKEFELTFVNKESLVEIKDRRMLFLFGGDLRKYLEAGKNGVW